MKKQDLIALLQQIGGHIIDIKRIVIFGSGTVKIEFLVKENQLTHNCIAEYNNIHFTDADIEQLKKEIEVVKRR
ncbi:MAG: hypothetical protein PHO02_06470 [Candidatus Nanoarchaeia archaeon]|nr:hypothetical protein [Candidatus Nanoarchaeia archaeon]